MGAGFVRLGGISAFLALAVLLIGLFIVGAMAADAVNVRTGQMNAAAVSPVPGIIVNVLVTLFILVSLLASKSLFNGMGYKGGDIPIIIASVCLALVLILGFIGGAGLSNLGASTGARDVMGIVSLIILLLLFISYIWFSISCISFGGKAKMGLWKAIGILFLIVGACFTLMIAIFVIMAVTQTPSKGMAAFAGVLFLIGGLVWIAAMICHGIGLLIGAGRMQGQPA